MAGRDAVPGRGFASCMESFSAEEAYSSGRRYHSFLRALARGGADYSSRDPGDEWLANLPLLHGSEQDRGRVGAWESTDTGASEP